MKKAGASAATADVITRGDWKVRFFIDFKQNTENLKIKIEELIRASEDIQVPLDHPLSRSVENWHDMVRTVLGDATMLTYGETINWWRFDARINRSRRASEMIAVIQWLLDKGRGFEYKPDPIPSPIRSSEGVYKRDPIPYQTLQTVSWSDFEVFPFRKDATKNVVGALQNNHVNMVGVYGMSGVGKTTIMQSITKKAKDYGLFGEVVTVIVQSPDIQRIQKDIAEQLDLDLSKSSDAAADLSERLKQGKPKLIFLDDMWEKLDLATVGIPYKQNCKVFFTTRNQDICKQMKTDVEIEVGVLEHIEAWRLFDKKNQINDSMSWFPSRREIATEILWEINGVPLVIQTLGLALKHKNEIVWRLGLEQLKKINTSFYSGNRASVARNLLMVSVARSLLPKAMAPRVVAEENDFFEPYSEVTETFEAMNLHQNLLTPLSEYGCKNPSNIQKVGIVPFCKGDHVLQHVQSGLGRTITLCIGVLQRVQCNLSHRGLVLAPTLVMVREIEKLMRLFGDNLGMKIHACGTGEDLHIVSTGVHVFVGTPVDFLGMLKKQPDFCASIKVFVLDELDTMVSHGFKDEVETIFEKLTHPIQVGVFAENISGEVLEIAGKLMKNPVRVQVQRIEMKHTLGHVVFNVAKDDGKLMTLYELLQSDESGRLVIFVNTRQQLASLANILKQNRYTVFETCSDMTNRTRHNLIKKLEKSTSYVVITTDLWARGIKFDKVPLIINYDLPFSSEQYRDRVIRVLDGVSVVNFVTADDWSTLFDIQSFYGLTFTRFKYFGVEEIFDEMQQLRQQSINHYFFNVEKDEWKLEALEEMEQTLAIRHSVIFVNSLKTVNLLADKLHLSGHTVFKTADMIKFSEDITRESLETKGNCVLITTELWPPGIDLEMSTLVINYDMPPEPKKYKDVLFRVSNSSKSSTKNKVFINFVTANDWFKLIEIQTECGVVFHCLPTQINDLLKEEEVA